MSLVLLDVDHFQDVNDTLGHQQGDETLRAVAVALAAACRDGDLPARYGGEEFAVLLPVCAMGEAYLIAERLRAAVAELDLPMPITVSAGVAALPAHAADAEGLLRKADDALYAAKRGGRNRTVRARSRVRRSGHAHRSRGARGHLRAASPRVARRAG